MPAHSPDIEEWVAHRFKFQKRRVWRSHVTNRYKRPGQMRAQICNGYAHEGPCSGRSPPRGKMEPQVHPSKKETRGDVPRAGNALLSVSTLNSFHSQYQKLGDWC